MNSTLPAFSWLWTRCHRACRARQSSRDSSAVVDDWPGEFDGVVRAYLAARLFGNWVAYYGQGLHAIVEYLQVALAVVKMEAFRQHASAAPSSPWQTVNEAIRNADLLLVHLADAKSLSRRLG